MPDSQSWAMTTSTPEPVEERDRLGGPGPQHDGDPLAAAVVEDPHAALEPRAVRVGHQGLGLAHPGAGPGGEQQALGGHATGLTGSPEGDVVELLAAPAWPLR